MQVAASSSSSSSSDPVEGPPHFVSPDGKLRVWLVEPLGLISHHTGGPMTVEQARFLSLGDGDQLLERLARQRQTKPWFAHHWGACDGYHVDARPILIEGGRKWGRLGARGTWILLGPKTPTLVRMACSLGQVALSLAGQHLVVTDDRAVVDREPRRRLDVDAARRALDVG